MSNIEEKDSVETLVEMAEVAYKADYCGAWYPMKPGDTVAAICLKSVAKRGEFCEECDRRMENWNLGDERMFRLAEIGRSRR